jgi:hypothetical protein
VMIPFLGVSINDAAICSTFGGKLNLGDRDRDCQAGSDSERDGP